MGSGPKKLRAVLSCGCEKVYTIAPPRIGDRVVCNKHWRGATVKEVRGQWTAQCRNCQMNRGFGAVAMNADKYARRHVERTGHTVNVYRAGEPTDHEISPVIPGQTGLPF